MRAILLILILASTAQAQFGKFMTVEWDTSTQHFSMMELEQKEIAPPKAGELFGTYEYYVHVKTNYTAINVLALWDEYVKQAKQKWVVLIQPDGSWLGEYVSDTSMEDFIEYLRKKVEKQYAQRPSR